MEEQGIGSEVEIQSPRPALLQDDTVLLDGGGVGEMGEVGEGVSDVGTPDRLQRFYFESDALVLKNNVE